MKGYKSPSHQHSPTKGRKTITMGNRNPLHPSMFETHREICDRVNRNNVRYVDGNIAVKINHVVITITDYGYVVEENGENIMHSDWEQALLVDTAKARAILVVVLINKFAYRT